MCQIIMDDIKNFFFKMEKLLIYIDTYSLKTTARQQCRQQK